MLEKLNHVASKAAQGLRVRSALNPLLWLCAIVTPVALIIATLTDDELVRYAALAIASLPVISTCLGFLYFMFRSPERLQSEDYQLRHETLEMIRVSAQPIQVSKVSVSDIVAAGLLEAPQAAARKL